jgi:hypothetical protein
VLARTDHSSRLNSPPYHRSPPLHRINVNVVYEALHVRFIPAQVLVEATLPDPLLSTASAAAADDA